MWELTVVSVQEGWGTVALSPAPSWDGKYAYYTSVTMTAVPAPGYILDHWEGDGAFSGTTGTVVMDTTRHVTAVFTPSDRRCVISASVSSPGSGTVALDPPPPVEGYLVNTSVTVTARPAGEYAFGLWQGDVVGTNPRATILMDANKSITAVFNPRITTACDPPGSGTLALDPAQSSGYPPGTEVTVTATPATGYRFDHWSGDISQKRNPGVITLDAPKTVTAHFVEKGNSFPWWWIGVGIALLFVGLIIVRALALWARARSQYQD